MFTIMDQNSDGHVDIEEFIDGCMKLKGNAKSIDMMSLMYDNSIFMQEFTTFARTVQQQIEDLQEMMVQMSQTSLQPPCNKGEKETRTLPVLTSQQTHQSGNF